MVFVWESSIDFLLTITYLKDFLKGFQSDGTCSATHFSVIWKGLVNNCLNYWSLIWRDMVYFGRGLTVVSSVRHIFPLLQVSAHHSYFPVFECGIDVVGIQVVHKFHWVLVLVLKFFVPWLCFYKFLGHSSIWLISGHWKKNVHLNLNAHFKIIIYFILLFLFF